ncbi:MAG TPA: methionyl-tRNA formyltransferase [Acidobacteriota bacterium]|jgi:methionyl-tRNA formyltransferase
MRIVFMGTPDFAVPALKALAQWKGEEIAGVICQPDKPQGRGKRIVPTPVKKAAGDLGFPVYQPRRIRSGEGEQLLSVLAPDLIFVVAYGQILPKWFLDFPRHGAINLHASLLPRYRGAAPLQRAVLNGETKTGFTLMMMDEGMDTGPILAQTEFEIFENETAGELAARAAIIGAEFAVRELQAYLKHDRKPVPQDSSLATYAPPLRKEEGALKFQEPSRRLHNMVRALNPWPLAFCMCKRSMLFVHRTHLIEDSRASRSAGELVDIEEDSLLIQCGTGLLGFDLVQSPGKRIISGRDFANGMRLKPGVKFENGNS